MKYLPVLSALLFSSGFAAEVPTLAPKVAAQLVAEGKAVLVDVREPAEWAETGVAADAVLLPKSDFDGPQKLWKDFLAHTGDKEVILYCRSGKRAGTIASALAAKGIKVANAGGFSDWTAAGLPTRKSLEDFDFDVQHSVRGPVSALASGGTMMISPPTSAPRPNGRLIVVRSQFFRRRKRLVAIANGMIGRPDSRASMMMPSPATRERFGTSAVVATL